MDKVIARDGTVYFIGTVTRYQEGCSYEDDDCYETVYLVDSADGSNIWDTTNFENVCQYFNDTLTTDDCWKVEATYFDGVEDSEMWDLHPSYRWNYTDAVDEARRLIQLMKTENVRGYADVYSPNRRLMYHCSTDYGTEE